MRYQLKTPWKNGTTHVEFEPVELIAHIPVRHPAGDLRPSKSAILPICHRQVAALVPPPRAHPTRFHGVFTTGILPFALRASLSAVPNRSRRFGQHRREHVRPLRWRATDRGQHRRTHRHPRHPRPLRKARRAGESALPTRSARTARCGCVTARRARCRRRNKARPHAAATNPQARARPAVGNQREMATDGEAARPRDAEIPLANVRYAPKLALARPPPTRQTVRKGRLNCLYSD